MVCQQVTKAVIHILTTEGYLADVCIDDFYGVDIPELTGVAFKRMTENLHCERPITKHPNACTWNLVQYR